MSEDFWNARLAGFNLDIELVTGTRLDDVHCNGVRLADDGRPLSLTLLSPGVMSIVPWSSIAIVTKALNQ